jgi:hypothetical protein
MLARLAFAFCLALALPGAVLAQEAFTNRATELRERASADARTVASLPADTPVKVGERGGGWARVDAGGGRAGWLRIFHLRFPATAETTSSGSSALSAMTGALGFGRDRSKRSTIATTGIRGLSTEDIKNASPDARELARLHSFRVDQAAAERFAREGRLAAVQVDSEGGPR